MAFNERETAALESAVKGVFAQAVASLQAIGMTEQGALKLLLVQASIRLPATEVRAVLEIEESRGGYI
jgi:hypothetical protein